MPPIILVSGPTAVGKTTTARALAEAFPRSVHVPVDELRHLVVRGRAIPGPAWDVPRAAMDERAIGHAHGFLDPVIDDLRARGWLVLDTTDLDTATTVAAILDWAQAGTTIAGDPAPSGQAAGG